MEPQSLLQNTKSSVMGARVSLDPYSPTLFSFHSTKTLQNVHITQSETNASLLVGLKPNGLTWAVWRVDPRAQA